MTLSTTISRVSYPGAGSTGPFAFNFRIFAATDLLVTRRTTQGSEVTLVNGIDYTVAGVNNASGSVTLTTALAAGETLVIRRVPPMTQPTSIKNQGAFFAVTHENVFDRLVMLLQANKDLLDRSFKLSESYDPALYSLQIPAPAPGKVLGWNASGLVAVDPAVSTMTFGGTVPLAGAGSPEGNVAAAVSQPFGQLDAVQPGLKWVKRKGADAYGWVPDVPPLLIPALTTGTGSISSYGDSITAGQGAAPATESYVNVLTSALGGAVTNEATSGTGVYTAIANLYDNGTGAAPRNAIATLMIWMAGFNDLRRGGGAAKTIAKIKECLRAFIAFSFSNTSIAASDAAVTKVGVWTAFAPAGGITRAGQIAGNALSGVLGMSASWNFNGDSLIIGTFVSDGVTYLHGPATVKVDGVLVTTFDPNNKTDNIADSAYDNGRVPSAIVLRGLGSGAHTVLIEPTHATRPFILDYLSTLVAVGDAQPLLVGTPPRMNATGYATAPALASDAIIAQGAAAIVDVVNEFPDYPVRAVLPNSRYDLATGVSADNIHPNNAGHFQIARAFLDVIQTQITPTFRRSSSQAVAVGPKSVASAASTTALGDNASASGLNSEATGANSVASGNRANAHGSSASAAGDRTVAVGTSANAAGADGTAIGDATSASSASSTALGSGALATNTNTTCVGKGANSNQDRGTAVGAVAAATGTSSTAIGSNSVASHATATAVGKSAATDAANQVMLGTATETVKMPGGAFVGGTGKNVGFYGTAPIAKPVVTGSRAGNAALASALTQLAALGLITDSSTA